MNPATTQRLVIEELRADHAEEWLAALSDPRASEFFSEPEVTTLEALQQRIAGNLRGGPVDRPHERWLMWIVRLAETGEMVGRLEATTYDGTWGEVAYVFSPAHWGHGYATEAGHWMIEELRRRGIEELYACVWPTNTASLALVTRLGFTAYDGPRIAHLQSYDPGDLVLNKSSPVAGVDAMMAP